MDVTAGTRATAVSAALIMTGGIAVVLYGIIRADIARALGGACLTMTALTLIALVSIRRWTTNTQVERQRLADATRDAEIERTRYVAGQAALEMERERVLRDAASEREQVAARLRNDQATMRNQFEDERATLQCESFEAGASMALRGLFDRPAPSAHGKVVSFPFPSQPARERDEIGDRGVSQP